MMLKIADESLHRVRDEFPHQVREIEHAWIPLADGTRLAARYWLPETAEREGPGAPSAAAGQDGEACTGSCTTTA